MSIIAGVSLILAGVVNLTAGLLGLFPGMFEAAVANPQSDGARSVGLASLLGTPYGRYAIGHVAGAGIQLAGGSWFVWLSRSQSPLYHSLGVLCLVSLGLELWGWALKVALSPLSTPGLAAAALSGIVYIRLLQARASA